MVIHVKKWGNSASVRIPASVMTAAALQIDQAVEISVEGGQIILKPVSPAHYDLEQLLAGMKPETFHEEIDFGNPVGEEVW